MYIIPTIEKKNDKQSPTLTTQYSASNFVRLQPKIHFVQQYPLSLLYGYALELFDPFVVSPSSWRLLSVKNNADDTLLTSSASLSGLSANTYYQKLNTLYPLLNTTNVTLGIEFVVFTDLVGLTTDISIYTDQSCVLTEVNLTGHIATFSSTVREFTLDTSITSKTKFPIPAALKFTLLLNLSLQKPFIVYDLPLAIGQFDYVMYNNKMYGRSRSPIPISKTFTTRSDGGLLWI